MEKPLTIVCFLWQRNREGFQLPAACDYGVEHVVRLRNGLKRHLRIQHELVCFTDTPHLLPPDIKTRRMWGDHFKLGGCYRRLFTFCEAFPELYGLSSRFACIDLDCVLVGDVTPIFSRTEDFIINRYLPLPTDKNQIPQGYNGGLYMMDAGARNKVWASFSPLYSPELIRHNPSVIGTDQAWIRMVLGEGEATWGPEHGVYEARAIGKDLPADARMVMFAGKRDPSTSGFEWVKEHWQ